MAIFSRPQPGTLPISLKLGGNPGSFRYRERAGRSLGQHGIWSGHGPGDGGHSRAKQRYW